MPVVLAFDSATPATVAGLRLASGEVLSRRDDPRPGSRPNHAARLLALCDELLRQAGLGWKDVPRIGVGVGPGTFTGLRIGVATARALSQATGAALVPVSTLEALAVGAGMAPGDGSPGPSVVQAGSGDPGDAARTPAVADSPGPSLLAVLDARRGEAFAASWRADGTRLSAAAAVQPDALATLADRAHGPWLAAGDGAIRFRDRLESAYVTVPQDGSRLHLVDAAALCHLAVHGAAVDRDEIAPDYVRRPDAEIKRTPR